MNDPEATISQTIVFFDGDCLVCNRATRWLLRVDDDERLAFAPLQGETARALLPAHLRQIDDLDTMVVRSRDGKLREKSDAVVEILRQLGWPYAFASILAIAPRPWRDAAYGWIARNRKRLLSKDACPLPDPADRQRFLP